MGTKERPGRYDCYQKAEPDEPLFTMLGRDALAPYLAEIWAHVRGGEFQLAMDVLRLAVTDPDVLVSITGSGKLMEALTVAGEMRQYRRRSQTPPPSCPRRSVMAQASIHKQERN